MGQGDDRKGQGILRFIIICPFSSFYDLSSVFNNKAKATKMLGIHLTLLYKK